MNDEIKIPISLPLDSDNFLRRECPNCERQFKWFNHNEGDLSAEPAVQYFCPFCGSPASVDDWWTPEQIEYCRNSAGPQLDQVVQAALGNMFKGLKDFSYSPNPSFSLGISTPEPLTEPDDMAAVESPCHPNEPLKVPENALGKVHCLICGTPFAV